MLLKLTSVSLVLCLLALEASAQCGFLGLQRCRNRRPNNNNNGGGRPAFQNGGGGGGACPRMAPNHNFGGRQYVLTWRNRATGCNKMSWGQARAYCNSLGMNAVSLDTREKANEFIGLLGREGAPYFWSGGEIFGPQHNQIRWANGVSQFTNGMPFSRTGG